MDVEQIKILVSMWSLGRHLEDIEHIPLHNFGDWAPVVRAMANRTDVVEAVRGSVGFAEYASLSTYCSEALYEALVHRHKTERMKEALAALPNPTPRQVREIAEKYASDFEDVPQPADLATSFIDEMDRRRNAQTVLSGITRLDEMTYGIHNGQLTAIGGRPGTGKSAFMLQVALYVANAGGKVLYLPLEMTAVETMERIILSATKHVTGKAMRKGDLSHEDWEEVNAVLGRSEALGNLRTYVGVNRVETIKVLITKEQPVLVIIDQLSQLTCNQQFYSIRERFTYMTKTLKAMALELDVPIWLACQLNRNSRNDTRVTMEHLKESGSIEEDADNVILLYQDEEATLSLGYTNDRVVVMDLAKQRQGPPDTAKLKFVANNFVFKSYGAATSLQSAGEDIEF